MVIGHNTDIEGFEQAIKHTNYDIIGKNVLILGAGGVSPSIILALNNMNVKKILISNRTQSKAENLKKPLTKLKLLNGEQHQILTWLLMQLV